jgi:two-component system NtrC family sensor kinase
MILKDAWIAAALILKRPLSFARRPRLLFLLVATIVLIAIWGTTLKLINSETIAAEHAAAVMSAQMAQTYEAQVVRVVREIDQTLKLVKYAYEPKGESVVLQELKARNLLPPDLLFTVSIADSSGHILVSTRQTATTSVADQDYFESQRKADVLAVGRPQKNAGSEWKLQFSRRLNAADGGFSGIVVVSVDAAYFVSGYESSTLGEYGMLGTLGTDGVFRAMRSGETVSAGGLADYAATVPASNDGESQGVLTTSAWDGVRRYTSARELYDFPLAVIVGLSADEQLASTRRDAHAYLWRASGGSLLLVLIIALLSRMSGQLADSQSQLLQSEKMASVGQLAAGVAHEINNPIGYVHSNLTTLTGYIQNIFRVLDAYEQLERSPGIAYSERALLQALKEGVELDYIRQDVVSLLAESEEGITRVEKIVRDLKDFSYLDQAEWQCVDVHVGLENTLNIVGHELKYKADLVKEYGDLPPIECLASQLNQVFLNLLVNAAHAIERHGTITIRTGREGEQVWISIADTGKGIDPRDLKRIFEPFFTTKPIGVGTGLGLSVSYGIVQKHGGTMDVQSEPGKGTVFTIHLPIAQTGKASA